MAFVEVKINPYELMEGGGVTEENSNTNLSKENVICRGEDNPYELMESGVTEENSNTDLSKENGICRGQDNPYELMESGVTGAEF